MIVDLHPAIAALLAVILAALVVQAARYVAALHDRLDAARAEIDEMQQDLNDSATSARIYGRPGWDSPD